MRRLKLDGVLLLDKPVGPSSSAVLQAVKRLLEAEKAGHAGTLDPLASGLLPLLFGEATKFAQFGPVMTTAPCRVASIGLWPPPSLLSDLRTYLQSSGMTQAEAAEKLRIAQSRVLDLMRGKWEKFSLEMLITLEARVGRKVTLELAA